MVGNTEVLYDNTVHYPESTAAPYYSIDQIVVYKVSMSIVFWALSMPYDATWKPMKGETIRIHDANDDTIRMTPHRSDMYFFPYISR